MMKQVCAFNFSRIFAGALLACGVFLSALICPRPALAQQPRGYLKVNPINVLIQDLGVAYEHTFQAKEGRFRKGIEGEAFFIYPSIFSGIGSGYIEQTITAPLAARGVHFGLFATFEFTKLEKQVDRRHYLRIGGFARIMRGMGFAIEDQYDYGGYDDIVDLRRDVFGARATFHFCSGPTNIGRMEGYIGPGIRRARSVYYYKRLWQDYGFEQRELLILPMLHVGWRWVFGFGKQ